MIFTHGGKNIMVCLACYTLPCTPVCTGKGRTTPEMMSEMNICHITLNIMTNELRRSDLERKNILKNTFFIWRTHSSVSYIDVALPHMHSLMIQPEADYMHPLTWMCKWQYIIYNNSTWFEKPVYHFISISS